jgi:geranylgeranyl reductase family protein
VVYDVIVVGAGPAGAVLAYLLACCGIKVLILEKANLPRYKTCGGGLTYKAIRLLPFDVHDCVELEAAGGIVGFAGRELFRAAVEQPFAWLVMRDRFDHFLVQQAVKAGAHIMDGVRISGIEQDDMQVVVRAGSDTFIGKLLAGADGVNSVVAMLTGLLRNRAVGTALEAELEVSAEALSAQGMYATFDFGALQGGYAWIFPKRDHLSVGMFAAYPGKVVGLRADLERFISRHVGMKGYHQLSLRGHRIPLGGRQSIVHTGRVFLLGDAANLADPWLGEGIYYAVLSASIAAEEILRFFKGGLDELSHYTHRINVEINRQLEQAYRFARWVYRFPRIGSALLRHSRVMQQVVFGTIRGDYSFQQLNQLLLRQLPSILVQSLKGRTAL